MLMRRDNTGFGPEQMRLVKFKAMLQNTDRYIGGKTGGVFMFGGSGGSKIKTYSVAQLKHYNSDPLIATMESMFNPSKSSPMEALTDEGLIQLYIETKNRAGDKNFSVFYRIIFWALFSAAVNDEIYNNDLSSIVDLAYCLDFNEALMRDWCKAVVYVIGGNKLSETSPLKFETAEANEFFLHANANANLT